MSKREAEHGNTPQAKKREEEEDSDMPKWAKGFMATLKKEMGEIKETMQTATDDAKSAKQAALEAKVAIAAVEEEMEHMKKVAVKKEQITEVVREVMRKEVGATMNGSKPAGNNEGQDENRNSQIIIGGLEEEQHEDKILDQVNKFIASIRMESRVEKVCTFSDPSKIAMVQFKSKASKIGFYKKMKGSTGEWDNGDAMWWKNNDTVEKRVFDKTLGLIKHHLHNRGHSLKDIKIIWPKGEIKLKDEVVAKVTGDFQIEAGSEAESIKAEVERNIAAWKEKRGIEV